MQGPNHEAHEDLVERGIGLVAKPHGQSVVEREPKPSIMYRDMKVHTHLNRHECALLTWLKIPIPATAIQMIALCFPHRIPPLVFRDLQQLANAQPRASMYISSDTALVDHIITQFSLFC